MQIKNRDLITFHDSGRDNKAGPVCPFICLPFKATMVGPDSINMPLPLEHTGVLVSIKRHYVGP